MLLVGLIKYIQQHCMGKGRKKRVEDLVTKAVASGLPNTLQNRRTARRVAKQQIKPDKALIDRYAKTFLIGKRVDVDIKQIVDLAKGPHQRSR